MSLCFSISLSRKLLDLYLSSLHTTWFIFRKVLYHLRSNHDDGFR